MIIVDHTMNQEKKKKLGREGAEIIKQQLPIPTMTGRPLFSNKA